MRKKLMPYLVFGGASILVGILIYIEISINPGGNKKNETGTPLGSDESFNGGNAGFYRGVLISSDMVDQKALQAWKDSGQAVVLFVKDADESTVTAASEIHKSLGRVEYFFEIARNPELAEAQPHWMASIQGHPEWMRFYPGFQAAQEKEVVKVYPWVPVLYREAFDAHIERLQRDLSELPAPSRIWLHDLQGAPSACGCGHTLCRWTADYGPKKTAATIGDIAAADFTREVMKLSPGAEVVPILAGECEAEDKDGPCAGVGCYEGICWKAFSRQLDPLAEVAPLIGASCLYKEYGRDLERYGAPGQWAGYSVRTFESMPPQRGGKGIPASRVLALLQGWDVGKEAVDAQWEAIEKAGAAGGLISLTPIVQDWEPKKIPLP